jgi:hypothetical protein
MASPFEYFTGTLTDLISIAKNAVKGLFKKVITSASSRLVGDLKELGVDISEEYKHVVDNYAIRHAFNNHGGKGESLRGQIPINNSDFELIPEIVNNYDNITTILTRKGLPGILYEKTLEDGTTVYEEEIHNKHKELTLVSMRKIKRPTLLGANQTNELTPIPSSGKPSTDKVSDTSSPLQENGELFRFEEDAVSTADTFTSAAEAIAQQLGVEIEIDENMPAKGSYNPRTGRIRINPSRHATAEDIQRTVLHETIGHGGIQAVAGKRFGQVCQQVYDMMSDEPRSLLCQKHQ